MMHKKGMVFVGRGPYRGLSSAYYSKKERIEEIVTISPGYGSRNVSVRKEKRSVIRKIIERSITRK